MADFCRLGRAASSVSDPVHRFLCGSVWCTDLRCSTGIRRHQRGGASRAIDCFGGGGVAAEQPLALQFAGPLAGLFVDAATLFGAGIADPAGLIPAVIAAARDRAAAQGSARCARIPVRRVATAAGCSPGSR